jgi:hypothetical protein
VVLVAVLVGVALVAAKVGFRPLSMWEVP